MTESIDAALARRIERLAARDVEALVAATSALYPDEGATSVDVAGGVAGFLARGSPANGAIALGLSGAVEAEQIDAVEAFFRDRGELPVIAVCPAAHPTLAEALDERGWVAGACENVLVREIHRDDRFEAPVDGVEIREAVGDRDLANWALMAAHGFSAPDDPTEAEIRLAMAATCREDARFLFGVLDGEAAGTGQLEIVDDLAWLSADTTLPRFRCRGVQGALQRARLGMAQAAGCTLAVTEAAPGTQSERNMKRLGFRVAYTRIDAHPPVPGRAGLSKGTER